MPRLCFDCIRDYQRILALNSQRNDQILPKRKIRFTNKWEYCKKIVICIFKIFAYCLIAMITLNISKSIYNGVSLCFWNFAFYFIPPLLKLLIASGGLLFLCFKDKFDRIENNENRDETFTSNDNFVDSN